MERRYRLCTRVLRSLEIAQVDLGGAGSDATTIRGITEIAGGVEFRIQRATAGSQLLQQVAHARKTRLLNLIRADDGKRLRGLRDVLQDARAGDDDFLQGLRSRGRRLLRNRR